MVTAQTRWKLRLLISAATRGRSFGRAFALSMLFLSGLVSLSHAEEPWTLEHCLTWAMNNSPDARIAEQRIIMARADLQQANSAFWPQLKLQSSYIRTDNPVTAFGIILNQQAYDSSIEFNDVPDVDNLNVRGLVTVPLYAGGRNMAERNAAEAGTNASREDAAAIRNTLAFEVARAYYSIQKTRAFVSAADAAVNSLSANLRVARDQVDAGTAVKTEALDLEVQLAQAQEDLVRARNAAEISLRALRNLLGIETADVEFIVAEDSPELALPDTGDYSNRPDLTALRQRRLAAESGIKTARAGYLPRVDAFGSADYDRGWELDGRGSSYTAGIMLSWDLWDGQRTRSRVSSARAEVESLFETERKLRLAIGLEAQQAQLNLEAANQRLEVSEKAIALAAESAELTRARFEQGLALAAQLIDAETALTSARVRRAEAEADQRIALSALRKALGLPQLEHEPTAP